MIKVGFVICVVEDLKKVKGMSDLWGTLSPSGDKVPQRSFVRFGRKNGEFDNFC